MDLKKRNKLLEEQIIVLKNYCNVLKRKHQINLDSRKRDQQLIQKLKDENNLLRKELKKHE